MASSIREILGELFDHALDERDKGDRFERLIRAYLSTDATWADRFSDVWLWRDYPLRAGRVDVGIDLVAIERDGGGTVAIQCKCYELGHTLQKGEIDSFFTASGTNEFAQRMIVSTTPNWSKHAEAALVDQQIPVTRLDIRDLEISSIDWSRFSPQRPDELSLRPKKTLLPHQVEALEAARTHYVEGGAERGKLIMACGTGKTFTSLRIAEDLAGPGSLVLFLVPSISLLAQTVREWTIEAQLPLRCFAVCSDARVGRDSEDTSVHDLPFPAGTDGARLAERISALTDPDAMTVVFSTYQSLPAVVTAQDFGIGEFDLVLCDEAHRTTGVTLAGEDESAFVKVHNQAILRSRRRLYMTATPRIYGDGSKQQAADGAAELCSMDDETVYGTEFHRLGFGEAVGRDLLTDYKVLVLAVDEKAVSTTFQAQLADADHELNLDDAARIVGCWNGLAKRGQAEFGFGDDPAPMRRAVAFSRSIADSKRFTSLFTEIVNQHTANRNGEDDAGNGDGAAVSGGLRCEVDHVDGTFNILRRNELLSWLKEPIPAGGCRILSNARCLSEGVDVPALDAVIFLNPRNSIVDVVQSVGRVMRKDPAGVKRYGYVILPVGIPAGLTPEQALADNKKYKVVWQVLQALRAHDERFNALINKIELNKVSANNLQVIGARGFADASEDARESTSPASSVNKVGAAATTDGHGPAATVAQGILAFPQLGEWREAIYARIVKKVGDRRYWEDWARDVAGIAERQRTRITALLDDPNLDVAEKFEKFLDGLRGNLNDSITVADAVDMLAQHLITKPVFDALFDGYNFTDHNPVSQVMQAMLDALHDQNLQAEQAGLEKFYDSVRLRAEGIETAAGKQKIITELYDKFFRVAFPRTADKLGIVYTPVEIVDFILRSVQDILAAEFGASLTDPGVHVLDPFTGTGTFIARLLQSGHIRPEDLARKYESELHANEILLLAYYIAAINIEATYHGLTGAQYKPFGGIVLTDTFQITEDGDVMDEVIFPNNNARVAHQKTLDIRVIVGNPPYSKGQDSQNDANQNLKYPTLDGKIAATYAARSTATNKNSLYDSYIRAIRWASDRIAGSENGGIIAFVSNGGFLDGNTADGLRKTLAKEFSSIHIFNLRGNRRQAGAEGRPIFEAYAKGTGGSIAGIAVVVLVKKPNATGSCRIDYAQVGDFTTARQKLQEVLDAGSICHTDSRVIVPNEHGDWLNPRSAGLVGGAMIGDKSKKSSSVFDVFGPGLQSNRDAWVYNSCRKALERNVARTVTSFNAEVDRYALAHLAGDPIAEDVAAFVDADPTKISWSSSLLPKVSRGRKITFEADSVRTALYRPFCKQHLYFDGDLNHRVSLMPRVIPHRKAANVGILVCEPSNRTDFAALMTDLLPDSKMYVEAAQFFPRYTYTPFDQADGRLFDVAGEVGDGVLQGWRRMDNIADDILTAYQQSYGPSVTKDDIFHYVYGLLHCPDYRATFAADLKRMLPRIPQVSTAEDFRAFVDAGRQLGELHVGYETVEPYPLKEEWRGGPPAAGDDGAYLVEKMRFAKDGKALDRSTLVVNSRLTLTGIPEEAHAYQLGSRSALEWVIDRYQIRTDKASGIRNDPNDWAREHDEPRYIVDLVKRVVAVSVETVGIVSALPPLSFEERA